MNMVYRYQYRAFLDEKEEEKFSSRLEEARIHINDLLKQDVITVGLYRYEHMLFAYYETTREGIKPEEIFSSLLSSLVEIPSNTQGKMRKWIYMYPIYWHSVPESEKEWARKTTPEFRRGRIAFLKPKLLFEYVEHHIKIVQEGLLKGDKRQFISLHENVLFSYFEEPKEFVNIKKLDRESEAIQDWLAKEPEKHFQRTTGQKGDFLMLPPVIAMGR